MYIDGGEVAYKYYVQGDSNSHVMDMNNFFYYFTCAGGSISLLNPSMSATNPILISPRDGSAIVDLLAISKDGFIFSTTDMSTDLNGYYTYNEDGFTVRVKIVDSNVYDANITDSWYTSGI